MSFSKTFDTVGNTLTGLQFSAKVESIFLKTGFTSANVGFVGKDFL